MHDFVPSASLVITDYHIADDGVPIVSSFLLRRLIEYHGVSRARFTAAQQYPFLTVSAPTTRHLTDNFPIMTRAHFDDLARSHQMCTLAKASSRAMLSDMAQVATRKQDSAAHRQYFQSDVTVEGVLQFPTICTMAGKTHIIAEISSYPFAKRMFRTYATMIL
ncbi:hypothetical protein BDR06DRAFT_1002258 [Suillus hirtellus]|nr:hypothetical protein BDR06DRAFT_1002258 [Suillus hirtellus]